MTNDNRIVIACGNPAAELLAAARSKVLLCGNKDIGGRVQPQILGSPLPYKVIGYDKHGFLAKP